MSEKTFNEKELEALDVFIERVAPYLSHSEVFREEIRTLIDFYERMGARPVPVEPLTSAQRQAILRQLHAEMRRTTLQTPPFQLAAEEQTLESILGPRLIGFQKEIRPQSTYKVTLEIRNHALYLILLQAGQKSLALDGCLVRFFVMDEPERTSTNEFHDGAAQIDFQALGIPPEQYPRLGFIIETPSGPLEGSLGDDD